MRGAERSDFSRWGATVGAVRAGCGFTVAQTISFGVRPQVCGLFSQTLKVLPCSWAMLFCRSSSMLEERWSFWKAADEHFGNGTNPWGLRGAGCINEFDEFNVLGEKKCAFGEVLKEIQIDGVIRLDLWCLRVGPRKRL